MTTTFPDVLEKSDVFHDSHVFEETDVFEVPDEICIGRFWIEGKGRLTTFFDGPVVHPKHPVDNIRVLFDELNLDVIATGVAYSFMFKCDHISTLTLAAWTHELRHPHPAFIYAGDHLTMRIDR